MLKEPGAPLLTAPGSRLTGLRYRRPLDVVELPEGSKHSLITAGDFVTAEDGSGIVHMAPAFGADDYAVGQREGLTFLNPVAHPMGPSPAPAGTSSTAGW